VLHAIQARREAHEAGADEALLLSTGGGLCCGAVANLLVWCDGRWLTPPLSSGCLPGVMRGRALELGLAEEAELMWTTTPVDEQNGTADADSSAISRCESATDGLRQGPWLLLNSLGCRPLTTVNGQRLPQWSATEAEAFWRQLAAGDPR
jgi:hypothetical protein